MRTLLHISDVHFGPPHLPRVSEEVVAMVEERRPSLLVVSGDLTQRARPEQFQAARRFVDRMPVPTLVVPGNHDVPLYRVFERAFAPFRAYREHFSPELEPVYRDDELLVVGINSAFNWTFKDGRIELSRLLEVGEIFAAAPACAFKVAVVHHQLIPPPNFGTQRVLANAYEAIDLFASVGVDLVLSGHLHQAYIGSSEEFYPKGRPPVVILHSGTTTSNRGRAGERGRNTCNWIVADERSMLISHCRWQDDRGRFAEQSRHWYPRQTIVPYTLEDLKPPGPGEAAGISSLGPIGGPMSSEGDEWQIVKTVGTEEEATVVMGFLRASGIPAEIDSLHVSELPFDIGEMSDVRVRVPADRAGEARELLAASEDPAAVPASEPEE